MGKSPARWIKSVLFGKKSTSRSASTKRNDALKGPHGGSNTAGFTESAPVVISNPVLVTAAAQGNGTTLPSANPDASGSFTAREEQAAIKAQAAFRGYQSRRAFRGLKGIVRLQAVIRGYLVRRQAVATLRAMHAIVRVQAMARGGSIRHATGAAPACNAISNSVGSCDTWKSRSSSANVLARRLLSSVDTARPLRLHYDQQDPNSPLSWLERWSITRIWKPTPQPKKSAMKPTSAHRRGNYATETESGKLKRNTSNGGVRGVTTTESEKARRNLRKISTGPELDSPLTELEKVKRSLRKVSQAAAEASMLADNAGLEKPSARSFHDVRASFSALPLSPPVPPPLKDDNDVEPINGSVVTDVVDANVEPKLAASVDNEEIGLEKAGDVGLPQEEGEEAEEAEEAEQQMPITEARKARRRSSASENGIHQDVPSYMLATESVKAKLRAQSSPKLVAATADSPVLAAAAVVRRHSLPSAGANGKMKPFSPRARVPSPAAVKSGGKGDRAFSATRDGNDRNAQVEWRR